MEAVTKARKVGGSVAVIVPKEIVERENIRPNDNVRIRVERVDELGDWWGQLKWVKKPTGDIMKIIDESEDD